MKTMMMVICGALALSPQGTPSKQEKKDEGSRALSFFEYRDGNAGMTLKMENGKVDFTADSKSYKSDSWEAFRRQYPELVKRYDLDRIVPKTMTPGDADRWWNDWASRFGVEQETRLKEFLKEFPRESTDTFRNLDRWFEDERRALDDLERRAHADGRSLTEPAMPSARAALGVLVSPVTDVLRSQLGLPAHEGLVVAEVEKGGLGDRSGIEKHDILLKISGQPIGQVEKFRDQVSSAMKGTGFTLECLRGGKPQMITIHPSHT